jgi:hypothetical protein
VLQQHQVTVTVIYKKSNPFNILCFFIQSFEQCHQHSIAHHCRSRSTANLRLNRHRGLFMPPAQNTTLTRKKSRRLPNGVNLTHTSSCWWKSKISPPISIFLFPLYSFFSFEAFVCSIKSKQTRGTQFQFIISYGPPEYIIKRNTGISTRRYKTKLQLPSCYGP